MDRDEFRARLEQVADVQMDRTDPTVIAGIAALHPQPQACGDCGLVVDFGPRRLITYRNDQRQIRCLTCRYLLNPATGRFDKLMFVRKKDE